MRPSFEIKWFIAGHISVHQALVYDISVVEAYYTHCHQNKRTYIFHCQQNNYNPVLIIAL